MTTRRDAPFGTRTRLAASGLLVLVGLLALPMTAHAAVTVSRAELNGSRLRLEGRAAANRTITVDGVALGTSDGSGAFRIERDPFAAPADCTVDVDDGSVSPTPARLSGCTVSSPPSSSSAALSALSVAPTDVVGGD